MAAPAALDTSVTRGRMDLVPAAQQAERFHSIEQGMRALLRKVGERRLQRREC